MAKRIQDDIIYQMIVNGGGGSGGITPTGTKEIAQNGLHDVAQYANAQVAVPNELLPADWVTGAYKEFNENYNLSSIQKMKIGVNIHLTRSDIVAGVEANDKIMMHGNVANNGTDVGDYVFWGTVNSITTVDNVERANITVNGIAIHMTTNFSTNVSQNGNYSTTGITNVNVNVPNSYDAGDEGKVVSGGALVAQTSTSVNENGTVDTTTNNEVVVNVPELFYGEGYTARAGSISRSNLRGAYVGHSCTFIYRNQSTDPIAVDDKVLFYGQSNIVDIYRYAVWGTVTSVSGSGSITYVAVSVEGSSIRNDTNTSPAQATITSNGTVDVFGCNQAIVNVQSSINNKWPMINETNTSSGSISLTDEDLTQNFSSLKTYAFYKALALSSVSSEKIQTVEASAFEGCSFLAYVYLPNLVTIGNRAFYEMANNCVITGNLNDSLTKVTSIGSYAFYKCRYQENIALPRVTELNSSSNCFASGLITGLDLTGLTGGIGASFANGCSLLTYVNAPNMTGMISSQAFFNCTALERAVFGAVASIQANAFKGDTSLQYVVIGGTTVCTLANTNAFSNCSALTAIYVPDDLVSSYKTATNWSTYSSKIKGVSEMPT